MQSSQRAACFPRLMHFAPQIKAPSSSECLPAQAPFNPAALSSSVLIYAEQRANRAEKTYKKRASENPHETGECWESYFT